MISKFLLGAMGPQSSGGERRDFVLCIKQEFGNDGPMSVNSIFSEGLLRNLNYIKFNKYRTLYIKKIYKYVKFYNLF